MLTASVSGSVARRARERRRLEPRLSTIRVIHGPNGPRLVERLEVLIRRDEAVLHEILCILAMSDDAVRHLEYLPHVRLHQLVERRRIAITRAPDEGGVALQGGAALVGGRGVGWPWRDRLAHQQRMGGARCRQAPGASFSC